MVVTPLTVFDERQFGYTSREFAEAGLMFYRARYYSPAIGRFIREDPVKDIYKVLGKREKDGSP